MGIDQRKFEELMERLRNNRPANPRHPTIHDVNLVRARKQLELMAVFYGFTAPDYFNVIDNHIAAYLKATNLDVLFKDVEVGAIFVYNHSPFYPVSLAFMLIGMNNDEIHKCLDYHKEQHKEIGSFNLLLKEILNHFNTYSPFSNDERLTIIEDWLEK
ncbi:MAG: hypothetical protein M0D57_13805 [Sphingobacteriales bacterium JAD_PAG50586_3]|nr:MAG: hypothetical protein M0D57_13805 [Sphingobacteriales bacterium JAD_PAG50586_3]